MPSLSRVGDRHGRVGWTRGFVAALFGSLAGCAAPQDAPDTGAEHALYWSGEDVRPALDHGFFDAHDLGELSTWADCVDGPDRPHASHRAAFATGNGRVYAMAGLADPVNLLHNIAGPRYSKNTRFFGDHWFTLSVDGEEIVWDRECLARPRGTGLMVTRADGQGWTMFTVDVAPVGSEWGDGAPAILRYFLLASEDGGHAEIRHHSHQSLDEDAPIERVSDGQLLGWVGFGDPIRKDEAGWLVDAGEIDAAGERSVQLAMVTADTDAELADSAAALAADPDLLDRTVRWWRDYMHEGLQLRTGDARVDDLYDGMLAGVRVQTTHGGGVSPMSRYGEVWLRDTIGPTRFLARAGRIEEAEDALRYLYACHASRGDYSNACSSDLDGVPPDTDLDWASMGSFGGRTGAEGPSYVPLAWLTHARWSGDLRMLDDHWDYVGRGLLAQQIDAQGRQTFSGDETYRLVMGAAQGYSLEYAWHELAWSANSSVLMRGAAMGMADAARTLGRDPAAFDGLADLAGQALDETFDADGGLLPFVFHTDGSENVAGDVAGAPFEDVSLKMLWAGAISPQEAGPVMDALHAHAGRDDGTIQSPISDRYAGQDVFGVTIDDGIATGMVPGYTLAALVDFGDPRAELSFNALPTYADAAGHYPEDLLYDDKSALQIIYDPTGGVGDTGARYRPWEGAINVDAMLMYLLGVEPVDGGVRLRPHVPNGLPGLSATGLSAGDARADLRVESDAVGVRVRYTAASAHTVWAELPVTDPDLVLAMIDGSSVSAEIVQLPGGESVLRFEPLALRAGDDVVIEARRPLPFGRPR